MLALRVASAVVGLPVVLALTIAGGRWFTAAVAVVLFVAALEFQASRTGWRHPLALAAAGWAAVLAVTAHAGADWMVWAATGLVAVPLLWLTLTTPPHEAVQHWLWIVGGVLYVGWLGSHIVLLRRGPEGQDWVLLALLATFATDTSSYFVGRAAGRRQLAPAISPGKTVEGSLGGLAFGVAAVILLNYFLGLRKEAILIVPVALLLPLVAEAGDLAESILKRGMGIKDASQLIPGHGGVMDRLDSVLFTVVMVYYYVLWVIP
jgi:phosphatidate cytidylyltransferase